MSKAEELASELDEEAGKSFAHVTMIPRSLAADVAEVIRGMAKESAQLRAELEAIYSAVPVAWIRGSGLEMLKPENGGHATVYASEGMSNHSTPLIPLPERKS